MIRGKLTAQGKATGSPHKVLLGDGTTALVHPKLLPTVPSVGSRIDVELDPNWKPVQGQKGPPFKIPAIAAVCMRDGPAPSKAKPVLKPEPAPIDPRHRVLSVGSRNVVVITKPGRKVLEGVPA